MKILGKQPSREKCAESGWFATDYLLDAPIDRAFILSLRPLGSFVYLDMLHISWKTVMKLQCAPDFIVPP